MDKKKKKMVLGILAAFLVFGAATGAQTGCRAAEARGVEEISTEEMGTEESGIAEENLSDALLYEETESETLTDSVCYVGQTKTAKAGSIAVDAAHFPDAVFREYVLDYLAGDDGVLSAAEMNDVKYLEFYYEEVSSLQGIEYFPNLQYLYCEGNHLTSLDLRNLSNLKEVECTDNALTSLKVSGLPKLKKLVCSENNLSSLTLNKLPALTELECGNNQLTALGVKGLDALQYLVCSGNRIKTLDLSGMQNLRNVDCEGNGMTTLKLTGLSKLSVLLCGSNSLTGLNLTELPELRVLYCYHNRLTGLDCTANQGLQELEAFSNQMSYLNLSGVSGLLSVNCSSNKIAVLDVTAAAGLANLIADNNCLPALNLAKNKKLKQVSLVGQIASAPVIRSADACQVDLSASGFQKKRVQNLSSGSLYANGITWKNVNDLPADNMVTYVSKTGRSGVTFPVTLKLTGIKAWNPKPAKVNLYQVKNTKGRKLSVKWKKTANASGYRIQYGTSAKFKKSQTRTINIKKGSTKSRVIKNLKKGKTYYVRVRAFRTYQGKKYYGAFSSKKKVKIKK